METINEGDTLAPNGLTMSSEVLETEHPETSPPAPNHQEVNKPLVELSSSPSEQDHGLSRPLSDTVLEENSNNASADLNGQPNDKNKTKKNKSVKFREEIVKDYLEAHDPWKNVPDWRTEDLIRAYKQECEIHGTKPMPKILQQLQCIENVGERYEILSLKGERLDVRQCESLESILKLVRFRCIDLEATHLDDEMAVALFEMVEFYESALKLNISFNKNIGPRGWMSCARLVRKTPSLTFIDAHNCDLNERVIPIMGRALRMGCFLTRLHLQSTGLAGRALMILVAAVKMNETLKELFLGDNKFMPTDGVQLGNLLKYNTKLELLDLRNNHLQDAGVGHICEGLSDQTGDAGLLTLVLWNNQITFQSMPAFNKSLLLSNNLETLNLGHNPVTNEGIHVLKDGLLKSRSLLKLGLSGTKVTCEGAVALAEVIADSPRLVRLDLQENDIKTAGLMALALALKVNESLTRLDLDRDTKKESGMKDYADQQKRLKQDINALLDRNRDTAHKAEAKKQEIERINQENARKLAEAAKDIEEAQEVSSVYIPSEDTIHRPKLLFVPFGSAERDLDSPVGGSEFFQLTSPSIQSIQLATPASELLSPQYCANPKVTAKKIFSVTRVNCPPVSSPVEPSPPFIPQIPPVVGDLLEDQHDIPIAQLCPPLVSVDLPDSASSNPIMMHLHEDILSPNRLQKALEDQTLVSMIKQIVGDTGPTSSVPISEFIESPLSTISEIEGQNDVIISSSAQSDKVQIKCSANLAEGDASFAISALNHSGNAAVFAESDSSAFDTSVGLDPSSIAPDNAEVDVNVDQITVYSHSCDTENTNSSSVQVSDTEDTIPDTQPNSCDTASNIPLSENDSVSTLEYTDKSPSDEDSSHSQCVSDKYANESEESSQDIEQSEQSKGLTTETVEKPDSLEVEGELNGNYVDCEPSLDGEDFETLAEDKDCDNGSKAEPGIDSELDQWNTVNESEIVDSSEDTSTITSADDNGNTNKPDFFSNLSLNGLKQELASLIDDEGNPTTVGPGSTIPSQTPQQLLG